MSNRYRLIKEYPESIKLGTIVYLETEDNYMTNMENDFKLFPKKIVENYPEFWEPVVEKDYEILSLIEGKFIYPCDKYSKDYINQLFNTLGVSIHSVKRNDGEIFTVGDRLDEKCFRKLSRHPLSEGIHDNIITKIAIVKKHASEVAGHLEIQNGKLMFSASNKWNNLNVLLSEAIKYKQPLFTTEDGVDIFEGDLFYYVKFVQYNNTLGKPFEIVRVDYPSFEYEPQYEKYFSTKEKAEEYILMNKPVLSLKDVANIYPGINKSHPDKPSSQSERLKNLVKSKIQQSV